MNPITETRYGLVRYVVLWTLVTAAYAAAFGVAAALPVELAAMDGAVFGAVTGCNGLILWNVLKYGAAGATTTNLFRIGRFGQITVVGIMFVAVAVGAETAAIHLITGTLSSTEFASTIPARSLITAAVYVCFALWYSYVAHSEDIATEANRAHKVTQTTATEPVERITVRGTGGKIEVIAISEVVFLQAEGDYVAIVTTDGRWLKEGTMKGFEEALPRDRFVRVHRSYIVAVEHISRIETSGRDHNLILRGGIGSVRISDAGYRLLKRILRL